MKIIIGARDTDYAGWIKTDINELDLTKPDSFDTFLKGELADAFLAEHVFEHITYDEALIAAKTIYKHLKPGGYFRCAVPDKNFRNDWYQNMVQVGGPGPKDHSAYTHKIVYDYKTLIKVFESSGFKTELLEYCDDEGIFHKTDWDPEMGMVNRSFRFDTRNSEESLGMISLIIDAKKED